MKTFLDKSLANLSSKAANTASSIFGQNREDVSLNAFDVSKLTQEEAISQLQSHNSALNSRVRQLQGATAENERYQQQIADLRSHVQELEADRARKADVYRQTQNRHKESLERLQLECDTLAQQAKQSLSLVIDNQALKMEVQEARAMLVMQRIDAAEVPADATEDWQALRDELQEQLQSVTQHATVLRGAVSADWTGSSAARLAEAETALGDSQWQAEQLSKKCEEMQEEIDVLQRQRAAALKAVVVAPPTTAAAPAGQVDGFGGDGWGFNDDGWDKGEDGKASAEDAPRGRDADSDMAGTSAAAAAAAAPRSAEVAVPGRSGSHCAEVQQLGSDPTAAGAEAWASSRDEPDEQAVLAYVQHVLRNEEDCSTAASLAVQLHGLLLENESAIRHRSPSLGPVDLVSDGGTEATAGQHLAVEQGPAKHVAQRTPAAQGGSITAPSSMSTVGRSPFHATTWSDGARDGDGNAQVQDPDSPAALSFNPLFDDRAATPNPEARGAGPGIQPRGSESPGLGGGALAAPLLPWESLKPHQLAAPLRVLQAVSAALASLRSQNGPISGGGAAAQPHAAVSAGEVPQTAEALREAAAAAEHRLMAQIAELGPWLVAAALPRKLSGLGSEVLPRQASQTGGAHTVPVTPRSPSGSPAASASIFGLHSTLQELLRAHQALLEACGNNGGEAGHRWRGESKRLAAEAEAELQRLQEVHVQQETEVAIQWHEKQQVQSAAQVQIAAKEQNGQGGEDGAMQELAVVRQQAEMYQAQLGDLDAAYEQLMRECHALRAGAQRSPSYADESASVRAASPITELPGRLEPSSAEPAATGSSALAASGHIVQDAEDLIQLGSGPGEETTTDGPTAPALVERVHEAYAPQVVNATAGGHVGGTDGLENAVVQLKARVHDLQTQLRTVTQDRDTLLVGIGGIEQAAAARLEKMEQELQAARAAAMTAAAELQQTCYEQTAEIEKLRSVIGELQAVVEDVRQGAEQQERQIAALPEAVKAREAADTAQGDDGRADADDAKEAKMALAAAQEQIGVLTRQVDHGREAVEALQAEHRVGLAAALDRKEALQKRAVDADAVVEALREAHAAELAGLREGSLDKLEDVRVEARELVKKGTADLQQALKGTQAQLQVARSDNAMLQEQHAAALRELQASSAHHVQDLEKAQSQIRELEAAAEGRNTTAQREIGRLQSENESLQGRVDRMQKLSKDKKAELEKLQAQHSSTKEALQAAVARADKAAKELSAAAARSESLAAKLKQAEVECKELADIKAKVKKAPSSAAESSLMQQVDALMSAAQQACQLLDEAKVLRSSADEDAALRGRVTELSAAAAECATAKQLVQRELAQAISDLAAVQDEMQVCKADLARVQKQAKKDRVQFETEMSKSVNYLASLSHSNLDAWPEAVQSLVKGKLDAAVEEARTTLQAEAMTALDEVDAQRSSLQAELEDATAKASRLEAAWHACEANEKQLREELRAQEAALQEQISALQLRLERAAIETAPEQRAEEADRLRLTEVEAKRIELEAAVESLRREVEDGRAVQQLAAQHPERYAGAAGDAGHATVTLRAPATVPAMLQEASRVVSVHRLGSLAQASSNQETTDLVEYWKQMYTEASERTQNLQKEVSLVQMELEDERHVHELRTLADGARKLEIQELRAVQGRVDLNVEYLKNVLLAFFESGELPLNKQVLVVLDRLMLFTPQDRARVWKAEAKLHKAGWIPSLFK